MRLVAALLVAALVPPTAPVQVMLDRAVYAPGLVGHVQVRAGQDGYLLVLHADPEGRVRVAFPLDPDMPTQVHAGQAIDITTRRGRAAFTVEDTVGSGLWYAAISTVQFRPDSFALGNHWDYRRFPTLTEDQDWNAELTRLVSALAEGRFDHDIATYRVVPVPTPSKKPRTSAPSGPYATPRYPGVRL